MLCHAYSLEARALSAHPATVGSTPAEWLEKTGPRPSRAVRAIRICRPGSLTGLVAPTVTTLLDAAGVR